MSVSFPRASRTFSSQSPVDRVVYVNPITPVSKGLKSGADLPSWGREAWKCLIFFLRSSASPFLVCDI